MDYDCQVNFTLNLMQGLGASNGSSMLVSPMSILVALSMAYAGSGGKTRQEFDNVFCVDDQDRFHDDLNAFLLKSNNSVYPVVKLWNQGYVQKGLGIREEYQSKIYNTFNARLQNVDLGDSETANLINKDVSSATNGRIKKIQELVLLNTIFFKADWKLKFGEPYESDFFSAQNSKRSVKVMNEMSTGFQYIETDAFHAVRITFDCAEILRNRKMVDGFWSYSFTANSLPFYASFLVFMPRERFGLSKAFASLNVSTVKKALGGYTPNIKVNLTLPQFAFEYQKSLPSQLSQLGLSTAFGPGANFSRITTEDPAFFIGDVLHKIKIELTRQGTEATAVTVVRFNYVSNIITRGKPKEPKLVQFNVDQPFVYMIVGSKMEILFSGIYN